MSPNDLRACLAQIHTAMIVSVTAHTVPDMRKTDNPYWGRVVKVSHVNGIICWGYARAVNRQRQREERPPIFEASARAWGHRIRRTPLVEYRGRYYLEVKVQSRRDRFLLDGLPVDVELLSPWLRQRQPGRQDLDREVELRDFALESIREIRYAGQTHTITLLSRRDPL